MKRKEWEKCVQAMVREREKMEKTKHTPGPWSYGQWGKPEEWEIYFDDSGDGTPDATVLISDAPDDNSEANARLIAAAPDLLDALRKLVNGTDENTPVKAWDDARNAIAKAEGRE